MCRSQLREKLKSLSLAKAFCLKVSGCVIGKTCGFRLTMDPGPVSLPSLLLECPLAPECRLAQWNMIRQNGELFTSSQSTHPSLRARLFLLRRPTCGCCDGTCCLGGLCSQGSVCTLRNRFTFSIVIFYR